MIYLSTSIQEMIDGPIGDDTYILNVYRRLQFRKHLHICYLR